MERSEVISMYRDQIMVHMVKDYRSVLECNGRIQYQLYIWEDGEIEELEDVHGSTGYLQPRDAEPRALFYVGKVACPYFDPWDCTDHSAPEDEAERERERMEIINWCMEEYESAIDEKLDEIIDEAKSEEVYDAWFNEHIL